MKNYLHLIPKSLQHKKLEKAFQKNLPQKKKGKKRQCAVIHKERRDSTFAFAEAQQQRMVAHDSCGPPFAKRGFCNFSRLP